jgi:hypothetical protein
MFWGTIILLGGLVFLDNEFFFFFILSLKLVVLEGMTEIEV